MNDTISRQEAIDAVEFGITYAKAIDVNTGESKELFKEGNDALKKAVERLKDLSSAESERLTDDDFETIRIHLNAQKEKLCNQRRWEEAEEYQRIIDRFMAFASAEPSPCDFCKHGNDCEIGQYCLAERRGESDE